MKALWDWIRSADKRPYLNYSFEELLEEAKRLKPSQKNQAESIKSEIRYRKRLKIEKRKLISKILLEKSTDDQIHQSPSTCEDKAKETEDGQDASGSRVEAEIEGLGEEPDPEDEEEASYSREELEIEELQEESYSEAEPEAFYCNEEAEIKKESYSEAEQTDRVAKAHQFFTIRTLNVLHRHGITDFNKLELMNDNEILLLKGVGQQTLSQIRSLFPFRQHDIQNESHKIVSLPKRPKLKEPLNDAGDLESEEFFDLNNVYPFASYPKITKYFSDNLSRQQITALLTEVGNPSLEYFLRRCDGETLQSIGDNASLTRERVRQHCVKIEKKSGLIIKNIIEQINQSRSQENESEIALAFEKDLSQNGAIGDNVCSTWQSHYQRPLTLADRISLFEKYNAPISLAELNSHIDSIESGIGAYGGESYWKRSTVRSLIWCMSIRLGKTGIMPKQVEMPRLLSRYIQKDFGGQRRAAEIFDLEYIGPIGSRNRSYWTEERIAEAVLNTQIYFCIPAELMPEQSHLNYYLDIDNDDDTKGPSCVAAMKRLGSWEDYAKELGLQVFTELSPEKKSDMEKQIAINFWNKNIPFSSKSNFLDSANVFMNTFWRAPSEPLKYNGVMTQMRCISRLISDGKIQLTDSLTMQYFLSGKSSINDGEHDSSNNRAIDEIMDILF